MKGNMDNLPKWASAEIRRLEASVEWYKGKLQEGPEDSNTFADPYGDAPRPLGKSPTVMFTLDDGTDIRVTIEQYAGSQVLNVSSGSMYLNVMPRASNSVEITGRRG